MTLKQNVTSILECYFTGFKDEIIEACANRIMEQIERQTDLVKDSPSLVKGLVNMGLVKCTPPTDDLKWEDYVPFDVKEPPNHVGVIRGETDCHWK